MDMVTNRKKKKLLIKSPKTSLEITLKTNLLYLHVAILSKTGDKT